MRKEGALTGAPSIPRYSQYNGAGRCAGLVCHGLLKNSLAGESACPTLAHVVDPMWCLERFRFPAGHPRAGCQPASDVRETRFPWLDDHFLLTQVTGDRVTILAVEEWGRG